MVWGVRVGQQACPTDAIVFGNINDSKSAIVKARIGNRLREFYSIEMLHTLPNVSYMAKVRNMNGESHAEKHEG